MAGTVMGGQLKEVGSVWRWLHSANVNPKPTFHVRGGPFQNGRQFVHQMFGHLGSHGGLLTSPWPPSCLAVRFNTGSSTSRRALGLDVGRVSGLESQRWGRDVSKKLSVEVATSLRTYQKCDFLGLTSGVSGSQGPGL